MADQRNTSDSRCPRCFNKFVDQKWSIDPLFSEAGSKYDYDGEDYTELIAEVNRLDKGFCLLDYKMIQEIQEDRTAKESEFGITPTVFTPCTADRFLLDKRHILELRESTESILAANGQSLEEYLNYDENGIQRQIGTIYQWDWFDPDLNYNRLDVQHIEDLRKPIRLVWAERFYQAESPFYDGYYGNKHRIWSKEGDNQIDLVEYFSNGTTLSYSDIGFVSPTINQPTQTEKNDSISCYSIADVTSEGEDDAEGVSYNLIQFKPKLWWELTQTNLADTIEERDLMDIDEGKISINTYLNVYAGGDSFDGNTKSNEYMYFDWNALHFLNPSPNPTIQLNSNMGLFVVCSHNNSGFTDEDNNALLGSYTRLVLKLTLRDVNDNKYYVTYNIYKGDYNIFTDRDYQNEKNIDWEDTWGLDDYLIIDADKILSDINKNQSDNISFCYEFGVDFEIFADTEEMGADSDGKARYLSSNVEIKKIGFASLSWIYADRNKYYLQRAQYLNSLDKLNEEINKLMGLGLTLADALQFLQSKYGFGSWLVLARSYHTYQPTYPWNKPSASPPSGTTAIDSYVSVDIQGSYILNGKRIVRSYNSSPPTWQEIEFATLKSGSLSEVLQTEIPENMLVDGFASYPELLVGPAETFNPSDASFGDYLSLDRNDFLPQQGYTPNAIEGSPIYSINQNYRYQSPYVLTPTGTVRASSDYSLLSDDSMFIDNNGMLQVTTINRDTVNNNPGAGTVSFRTSNNSQRILINYVTGETSITDID